MSERRRDATQTSEVLRLIGTSSDAVLDAQIMKRPVPAVQVAALADAARLLRDHDVALPPVLLQVLHGLDRGAPSPTGDADALDPPDVAGSAKGLARFLRPFRTSRAYAASPATRPNGRRPQAASRGRRKARWWSRGATIADPPSSSFSRSPDDPAGPTRRDLFRATSGS